MIEEIKTKQKENSSLSANVTEIRSVKVLLADDDVFSNLALKSMIEKSGKFQALPCFNGQEVSN